MKKPPNPPPKAEISASDGAKRLGLSAQAIGMWVKRSGAPARIDGRRVYLQWPSFARWREEELAKQAVSEATKKLQRQLDDLTQGGIGNALARIDQARATMLELDVAERTRALISVTEASEITEKLCTDLRAQLLPFPRRWAPELLAVTSVIEMEQRLDKAIARTLDVLAHADFGASTTEQAA